MDHIWASLAKPFKFVALLWIVFLFEVFTKINLSVFGILPRTEFGVIGIFVAPLLHGDMLHLISNSIPLLVLGSTMYFFYPRAANRIFFLSYFLTDALVWVFARQSIHIGSSGIVYGIAFYLLFIGLFRKDVVSIIISVITAFLYGGIIYGIFPGQPYVSWETHLIGAIVGVCCAFYFRRPPSKKNRK